MITSKRMQQVLGRRPFKPIRLSLSDGSTHDIPHPEFAWVFGGRVFIGVPKGPHEKLEGEVKELSILHLTSIEELSRGDASKK